GGGGPWTGKVGTEAAVRVSQHRKVSGRPWRPPLRSPQGWADQSPLLIRPPEAWVRLTRCWRPPLSSRRRPGNTRARAGWRAALRRSRAEALVTSVGTRGPAQASHIPVSPGVVHDRPP